MNSKIRKKLRKLSRDYDQKTDAEMIVKLFEEGGELAQQALIYTKASGTSYRDRISQDGLAEELADVYIVLIALAERFEISDDQLEQWVQTKRKKWKRVVTRKESL